MLSLYPGIRAAILEGDIDSALKLTNAYYPQVLRDHSHVYFKLRCRKFVELMRESTLLLEVSTEKRTKSTNGRSTAISDDGSGPDMDIDEPMKDGDDWEQMDTEEAENGRNDNSAKYESILSGLVQYGQELKAEFKDDQSPIVTETFTNMFSMFSYTDPRKSPHGKMLDPRQRIAVAEGLNSAILGNRHPFPTPTPYIQLTSSSSIAWQIIVYSARTPLQTNERAHRSDRRRRRVRSFHQFAEYIEGEQIVAIMISCIFSSEGV